MPQPLPAEICQAAMAALTDAVLITDASLAAPGPAIVYANPAWERMTGYSADEALGQSPRMLQGPATDQAIAAGVRAHLEQGETGWGITTNYHKDGTPFALEMTIEPLRDGTGAVTHYVAIQRDVTENQREERALNQLDMLARLQHDIAATDMDLDSQRRRVAATALTITGGEGAAVEEVEGREMVYRATAGTADSLAGLRLPLDGSISGYCYERGESIIVDDVATDPRRVDAAAAKAAGFVSGILVPLIHNGVSYGVLKVFASQPGQFGQDALELLDLASGVLAVSLANAAQFERAVQQRAILLNAAPTLISYLDTDLRYVEVNLAYEQRFGMKAEEIRGKHISEMLEPASYAERKPYLDAALAGEFVSSRVNVTLATGETRVLQPEYRPHFDRDGRVRGIYAMVHDLTDTVAAHEDYLTGLTNRRSFDGYAQHLAATAQRYGQTLSLLICDIDHFKAVNDRYGHEVGDAVLKEVAQVLRTGVREADIVARWGGEEFAVLMPETAAADATTLVERLRQSVLARQPAGLTVSASFGVAQLGAEDDLASLLARADERLYAAKTAGRNRVVAADTVPAG